MARRNTSNSKSSTKTYSETTLHELFVNLIRTWEVWMVVVSIIGDIAIWAWANVDPLVKLLATVTLALVNLIFIFWSRLSRMIKAVFPTEEKTLINGLPDLARRVHICRLQGLASQAQEFAVIRKQYRPKRELYRELIELVDAMQTESNDELLAISSTMITDFLFEELAQDYLRANQEASLRGVPIKRIFLLDEEDINNRDVREVIKLHHEALQLSSSAPTGSRESGVKWILSKYLRPSERAKDFALLSRQILVTQNPGGERYDISWVASEITEALRAFDPESKDTIWYHPEAKDYNSLPPLVHMPQPKRR